MRSLPPKNLLELWLCALVLLELPAPAATHRSPRKSPRGASGGTHRPKSAPPQPSTWIQWLQRVADGAEPAERMRSWLAVRRAVFEDLYDEAKLVSSRRNVTCPRPLAPASRSLHFSAGGEAVDRSCRAGEKPADLGRRCGQHPTVWIRSNQLVFMSVSGTHHDRSSIPYRAAEVLTMVWERRSC